MTKWLLGICITIIAMLAMAAMFVQPSKPGVSSAKTSPRVVSLAPSMTETMIALNQAHLLAGVTKHCLDQRVAHVHKIGSFAEPNFEAIIAKRPDLVLGVPHVMAKNVLDKIKAQGIKVFAHQPDSLSDIKFIVTSLALKFDVVDVGKQINERIDRAILVAKSALYQNLAKHRRRSALIVISTSPFVVAGRGTFASEIIEAIGFSNLASQKTSWPIWPLERLIAEPPAFLILAGGITVLPMFESLISSLNLDLAKSNIMLIVPQQPMFTSPSPAIIRDVEYLTDLLLNL
jgi:iron complex transport system substrate-binding protein